MPTVCRVRLVLTIQNIFTRLGHSHSNELGAIVMYGRNRTPENASFRDERLPGESIAGERSQSRVRCHRLLRFVVVLRYVAVLLFRGRSRRIPIEYVSNVFWFRTFGVVKALWRGNSSDNSRFVINVSMV